MKAPNTRSDLEDRSFRFAHAVRGFVRKLPKNLINTQDGMQLVRSSGSIGANYIEAQEALSKKDFGMRVKICRKEAKETVFWLSLFSELPTSLERDHNELLDEAQQLTKIFSSIVEKVRA